MSSILDHNNNLCTESKFDSSSFSNAEEHFHNQTMVKFHNVFEKYSFNSDIVVGIIFNNNNYVKAPNDKISLLPIDWTSLDQIICSVPIDNGFARLDARYLPKTSDKRYVICYETENGQILNSVGPIRFTPSGNKKKNNTLNFIHHQVNPVPLQNQYVVVNDHQTQDQNTNRNIRNSSRGPQNFEHMTSTQPTHVFQMIDPNSPGNHYGCRYPLIGGRAPLNIDCYKYSGGPIQVTSSAASHLSCSTSETITSIRPRIAPNPGNHGTKNADFITPTGFSSHPQVPNFIMGEEKISQNSYNEPSDTTSCNSSSEKSIFVYQTFYNPQYFHQLENIKTYIRMFCTRELDKDNYEIRKLREELDLMKAEMSGLKDELRSSINELNTLKETSEVYFKHLDGKLTLGDLIGMYKKRNSKQKMSANSTDINK